LSVTLPFIPEVVVPCPKTETAAKNIITAVKRILIFDFINFKG
jgi:hypothetical protein